MASCLVAGVSCAAPHPHGNHLVPVFSRAGLGVPLGPEDGGLIIQVVGGEIVGVVPDDDFGALVILCSLHLLDGVALARMRMTHLRQELAGVLIPRHSDEGLGCQLGLHGEVVVFVSHFHQLLPCLMVTLLEEMNVNRQGQGHCS